jgi:hypothetical protein
MMFEPASDLAKLYLAYFGRTPDFDGIQCFTGVCGGSIPLPELPRQIDLIETARERHITRYPAPRVFDRHCHRGRKRF